MEQKKILWIVISVAAFLCIVFAAGLLWLYPSKNVQTAEKTTAPAAGKASVGFDPVEWLRDSKAYPGITPKKEQSKQPDSNFTIVYGETDGKKAAEPPKTVPVPPAPVIKTAPQKPAAVVVSKAVETHKAVSRPVKTAVKEYWIQAGSYKSRTSAESARHTLSGDGLTSRITIKTIGGVDYYRVRIGPYSKKAEAEKFLGWVVKINAFKNSYISQVISRK